MGKVKSVVITVILALCMAVAAFFAFISFPVGKIHRFNSIASTIHLGAEYSGYAYTTVTPKGVLTAEEYNLLGEEDKTADKYVQSGSFYVEKEKYDDVEALKAQVASDAAKLNARFGQKRYSSYSVAVEDGLALKVSVPTNYTYAAYKGYDTSSSSSDINTASAVFASMLADGSLTLRTIDETITLTSDEDGGASSTYNPRPDDLTDEALTQDGAKTYLLTGTDDAADYFKGVNSFDYLEEYNSVTKEYAEELLKVVLSKDKEITSIVEG